MKIIYFQGKRPNFGDELNPWLWPRILPDFFDDNDDIAFLGIGSIIGKALPVTTTRKIVCGAAYVEEYSQYKPNLRGADWDVFFVRGPRTASLLDIPQDLALGDSALLLRTVVDTSRYKPEVVSFMPHWESLSCGHWEEVCRLTGINLIDPRQPVETVLDEMLRSKVVIAEAMHGAIVADALRIPWIPLLPIHSSHRGKWKDWSGSMAMDLSPQRLWPSSLQEAQNALIRHPFLLRASTLAAASPVSGVIDSGLIHMAAFMLDRVSKTPPMMSEDRRIETITEKMCEKIELLRKKYG
ncbi:MAG: hypothetical protein H6868_03950 [Rhodospirillales bacterium]|nr:hypothetical protein [Rhodospirillales bacterium]